MDAKTPSIKWPVCNQRQQEAALRVLQSGKLNYWTGDQGKAFEREYAQSIGRRHAVAVANGTLAIELALHAWQIGPGDEVIVPSRTFIATASAVAVRGARPVCADVDRNSQNLTADTIRQQLSPRTKAVIPVHLAGWPCDMDPILELAEQRNLVVIEDCAQAHGATYKGRPVGSMGHASAFSFCQDKILTTAGEGGMLLLDNNHAWQRAWSHKDHGKSYDTVHNQTHPPGFRWLHESFGSNYRMTEVQSAIGRVALGDLPGWVEARRRNAAAMLDELRSITTLRTPVPDANSHHSYYKFYTFVRPKRLAPGWDRDRIMREVSEQGVPCFSGSCSEIYREKAFPEEWRPNERLPVAVELARTSLMFLVDPTRTKEHMQQACHAIKRVMSTASADADASLAQKAA